MSNIRYRLRKFVPIQTYMRMVTELPYIHYSMHTKIMRSPVFLFINWKPELMHLKKRTYTVYSVHCTLIKVIQKLLYSTKISNTTKRLLAEALLLRNINTFPDNTPSYDLNLFTISNYLNLLTK